MKTQYGFILLIIMLMMGCILSPARVRENYATVPKTDKDIYLPRYESPHKLSGLPYTYWNYAKKKADYFNLPQLQTTTEPQQVFRVWISNVNGKRNQPHSLLRIIQEQDTIYGEMTFMRVHFKLRKNQEKIKLFRKYPLQPDSLSWEAIIEKMLNYKFDQLPTDNQIPNYYEESEEYANNKPTYSFEYATPDEYRFYQYSDLYRKYDDFEEPRFVDSILALFEQEFHWAKRGRIYFNAH